MRGSLYHRVSVAAVGAMTGLALLGGTALAWTGHVDGQPTGFQAGAADGYYVWHNNGEDQFHLRTTDSSGVYTYTGVLRTDGHFRDVELVRQEPDDHVQVLNDGHVIRFAFKTAEGADGIDFDVDGGRGITLRLNQNGTPINTSSVYLGQDGVHPRHNPFLIRRNPRRHRQGDDPGAVNPASPTPTATATAATG